MYISTKVSRRTRVGTRHGSIVLLLASLVMLAILPWVALIGIVAGAIWLCAKLPEATAQFIGGFLVFAVFLGLPTGLLMFFLASGIAVWAVPVGVSAFAALLYAVSHPEQRAQGGRSRHRE